jgi:hypothetical protein
MVVDKFWKIFHAQESDSLRPHWMGEKCSKQQSKFGFWGGGAYFLTREQVEGEVQGEDDVLQDFLKDIDKGPRHAHVVKLEKSEIEVQEAESGFEVRH